MKKICAIILLIMLFSLGACSYSNENVKSGNTDADKNLEKNINNRTSNSEKVANNGINDVEKVVDNGVNSVEKVANNGVNDVEKVVDNGVNGIKSTVNDVGKVAGNVLNDVISGAEGIVGGVVNDTENTLINGNVKNNQNNIKNAKSVEQNSNISSEYNNETSINESNDLSQRATNIAKTINKIEGVQKATIIITGDIALVGINLANDLSNEKITQIKKEAEQKALEIDKNINKAVITASPEIVDRIINITNDVGSGKPLSGLTDEISSIIKRIQPTM